MSIHPTHTFASDSIYCAQCGFARSTRMAEQPCAEAPPPPGSPARWAIDEARKRSGVTVNYPDFHTASALMQLAMMIERHETQPIDPVLIRARELLDEANKTVPYPGYTGMSYFSGKMDDSPSMRAVMAALREECPK